MNKERILEIIGKISMLLLLLVSIYARLFTTSYSGVIFFAAVFLMISPMILFLTGVSKNDFFSLFSAVFLLLLCSWDVLVVPVFAIGMFFVGWAGFMQYKKKEIMAMVFSVLSDVYLGTFFFLYAFIGKEYFYGNRYVYIVISLMQIAAALRIIIVSRRKKRKSSNT